jgi:putative ABC transport system substrate-binding protein
MMRRTIGLLVTLALGFLVAPLAADAQPPAKVPRISLLIPGSSSAFAPRIEAFRHGLRDLGYVEGHNITIEYRFAEGQADRLPELGADLVRLQVDSMVIDGTAAIRAAQHATTTIPIVMAVSGDPVGDGLVASLARPGGNITGLSLMLPEVSGKRLELLREAMPKLSHVAILWKPDFPGSPVAFQETQTAAHSIGLQLQSLEVQSPDEFDQAFAAMTREHADALVVISNELFFGHRRQLAELTVRHRLPAMFHLSEYAEARGLMAYGANVKDLYRRAATYVDKILKGAKPADLPVEQPTTFTLVINLKTAEALGLTIPPSLLAAKALSNSSAWYSSATCRCSSSARAAPVRLYSSGVRDSTGCHNTAMRMLRGTISFRSSNRFAGSSVCRKLKPVMCPLGCARLATNPSITGS